jgi:hypothetical protein
VSTVATGLPASSLAVAALALVTIGAAPAFAQTPAHVVDYRVSAGCPGYDTFARELEQRLAEGGRAVPGARGARLIVRLDAVDAADARPAARFVGELSFLRADRKWLGRELTGATCDELARAVAVVAAMMLEGRLADEEPLPEPTAEAVDPPPPPPPPATRCPACPDTRPAREPPRSIGRSNLEAGASTALGSIAPAVAAGLSVSPAGELRPGIGVEASAVLGSSIEGGDATLRLTLIAAALEGCLATSLGVRFEPEVCAGLESGVVVARGRTNDASDSRFRPWIAPRLALSGRYFPSEVLFVELSGVGSAPLIRDRYFVAGSPQAVHSTPALAIRLCAGLGVRFW